MSTQQPEDDFQALEPPHEEELNFLTLFYEHLSGNPSDFEDEEDYLEAIRRVLDTGKERYMDEFYRTVEIQKLQGTHEEFYVDDEESYRPGFQKKREKTVVSERGKPEAWIRFWRDEYEEK
ncbi:MAG: hypothetical protein ABEJ99_04460 [Candidatus Nanohaloarchaea archaeon]